MTRPGPHSWQVAAGPGRDQVDSWAIHPAAWRGHPGCGPPKGRSGGQRGLWAARAAVGVTRRALSSCELNQRYHLEQRNLNPSPTEQHPTRAAPAGPRGPRRGGPGVLPVRATLNDVRDPAYAFTRPSLHGRGSDAKAAQLQGALVHLDSLSPAAGGFAPGIPMSW